MRIGELIGEEPEAGEDGGPAVVGGLQVEDVDAEDVARFGARDVDGADDGVGGGEVEGCEGGGGVGGGDVVGAGVGEVEGYGGAGGDGEGGGQGAGPGGVGGGGGEVEGGHDGVCEEDEDEELRRECYDMRCGCWYEGRLEDVYRSLSSRVVESITIAITTTTPG